MKITNLTATDRPLWDEYVRNAEHGLPQHLSGWRDVLKRTYNYETPFLLAKELAKDGGETVVGVLPLFKVSSLLTGKSVSTLPGGLCADREDVAQALIARGQEIARKQGAKRFMVQDTRQMWTGNWQSSTQHEAWEIEVGDYVDVLSKRLHRNIRRQIRMAGRNGLTVEIDRTGALVGEFYDVLSRFTHQAGTPVFGRNFLDNVIDVFPDGFNIVVVRHEEAAIGGYFQLEMGGTIYGMWGAALREYFKLRPVYLAYWEILVDAIEGGYEILDMGRSPTGSNASKFKGQWGGTASPIYQQVTNLQNDEQVASVADSVQSDAKMRHFRQIWPKVPFPIACYLGPRLRRHIPFA